jgi:hypothetical protein
MNHIISKMKRYCDEWACTLRNTTNTNATAAAATLTYHLSGSTGVGPMLQSALSQYEEEAAAALRFGSRDGRDDLRLQSVVQNTSVDT